MQIQGAIERRLTTHGRQYGIRLFRCNDALDHFPCNWLNVGDVRHLRIGHDGCWIAIHQNDFVALIAQRFACLRARVIKFTSLANHDGACTNNQDAFNVAPLRHYLPPCLLVGAACIKSIK